jgi:hypothetical protein
LNNKTNDCNKSSSVILLFGGLLLNMASILRSIFLLLAKSEIARRLKIGRTSVRRILA